MNVVILKPGEGRSLPLYIGYFEEVSKLIQVGVALGAQQFAELMAHYDTEVVS